jgi:hypothetical protein
MARLLGPLVSSWAFEKSAQQLLVRDANRVGLYLDELARQMGDLREDGNPIRMERPLSVLVRETASRFPESQLPGVILECPGTIGDPIRDGAGMYSAEWAMNVIAVTQGTDIDVTRSLACDLCTAATAVLLHGLVQVDDRIVDVRWSGEDSIELDGEEQDQRSRSVVGRGLVILVQDLVCDFSGLPAGWDEPDPPMDGSPPLDAGDLETVLSAEVESAVPTDEPV